MQEVQVVNERVPVLASLAQRVIERFGRLYGKAVGVDREPRCGMGDGRLEITFSQPDSRRYHAQIERFDEDAPR